MARTILLADDSMTIQKVVELTFMDEDYQVVAVSDGTAAIQKLSEMRPDLLIADVHMPGAGGYDVCRHAKSQTPDLPVLLLVGTFEQFDQAQAAACGSDGHLKKPFDSQELLNRVEALVSAAQAAPSAPAVGLSASEPMVLPSAMPQAERVPELPSVAPQPAVAPVAPVAPAPPVFEAPIVAAAPKAPPAPVAPAAPEVTTPDVAELEAQDAAPAPEAADSTPDTVDTRPMSRRSPQAGEDESSGGLSDDDVDRIARRVVELISDKALKEVAWEVLPDLAEVVIRERIQELERQVESA